MSCNCGNTTSADSVTFACACDQLIFPEPLMIGAGLSSLPRQIATFPEFRLAMLGAIPSEEVTIVNASNVTVNVKPLSFWKARGDDDLGIMLLEMWAYICDALSFYDAILADESYLLTSKLRPDLRKLVALLGYSPRPAVAGTVQLAAIADGRIPVKIPAGTAFRSGSFDGNPPQVFETGNDLTIDPLNNQWNIIPPHIGTLETQYPTSLLILPQADIKEDALILIIDKDDESQNSAVKVTSNNRITGGDGQSYNQLSFANPTALKVGATLSSLKLMMPARSCSLWTTSTSDPSIGYNTLTLDKLNDQIKTGDYILAAYQNDIRWFIVTSAVPVNRLSTATSNMTINGTSFQLPGITVPVTQLSLDAPINNANRKTSDAVDWTDSMRPFITVYFVMQVAGTVTDEAKTTLASGDTFILQSPVEMPVIEDQPSSFLFQDKNTIGASASGQIDYDQKKLVLDGDTSWNTSLSSPVQVFGNVVTATRGETVTNEIVGNGDATQSNQTFQLKKSPLSYYPSPTANNNSGFANSLMVYVNGIKWKEVSTFFDVAATEQVYIVRQDDAGNSSITFGDGVRGARVPSGTNNITANYRFGAGAACPPAGSVNQISKPVLGLQSVKNMVAAFGGADAETADDLQERAPQSALILGRVVSLQDMEAVVGSFPGVSAVKTEWRWNINKQRAAAHVYFIGDASLAPSISLQLRNMADPAVSIAVEKAVAVPLSISVSVTINPDYQESLVVPQLKAFLLDKETGIFVAKNLGIGLPLYRSQIFEAILSISGISTIDNLLIDNQPFSDFATVPGVGSYFDINTNNLIINGQ